MPCSRTRTRQQAAEAARRLGFAKAVGDWRTLVEDPSVDVVSITTPNHLHKPIALAALQAGKAVYCEKPLAATLADAKEMAEAARGRPGDARRLQLPEEPDHRARPRDRGLRRDRRDYRLPRHPRRGLHGRSRGAALASAPIRSAAACSWTSAAISSRSPAIWSGRSRKSPPRPARSQDAAVAGRSEAGRDRRSRPLRRALRERRAWHDHRELGDAGPQDAARVRACRHTRLAGLHARSASTSCSLYSAGDSEKRKGFKTLLAGPDTPPYGNFCPAPGHQLGFNDLKTIEVAHLIEAIASGRGASPDFREAYEIQRTDYGGAPFRRGAGLGQGR